MCLTFIDNKFNSQRKKYFAMQAEHSELFKKKIQDWKFIIKQQEVLKVLSYDHKLSQNCANFWLVSSSS